MPMLNLKAKVWARKPVNWQLHTSQLTTVFSTNNMMQDSLKRRIPHQLWQISNNREQKGGFPVPASYNESNIAGII